MTTKREAAKQRIQQALERLTASLAEGRSGELLAFLRYAARLHKYSFGNQLSIATHCPSATLVAGFQAWKKRGRHVKKGERGIPIIAPLPSKRRTTEADEESTELRFRVAYVFDVSQTEGDPLPERPTFEGDPAGYLERLYAFASSKSIAVEREQTLAPGYQGLSHGGRIQLSAGLSPAEEFDVLAHELAHELLHKVPAAEKPSKTIRETEAQAVACVVSDAVGLQGVAASSDYILGYDGTTETVAASLGRIQRVSHEILEAIAPEEELEVAG